MRLAEQRGVAESLEVQSVVLAAAGEDEKAAMLAGAADALRTTIESQPYRFEVIFGERYLSHPVYTELPDPEFADVEDLIDVPVGAA